MTSPVPVTIAVTQKLWTGYQGDVEANPVLAGNVTAAADAASNEAVYAYDLGDGHKVWEYDWGNYYNGALAASPSTVVWWKTDFSVATPWSVVKVNADQNVVVIGSADGNLARIFWSIQVLLQTQVGSRLITGLTSDGNDGWIVSQGDTVTAVAMDGTKRWSRNFQESIEAGNVSMDGSFAVLATSSGMLYVL